MGRDQANSANPCKRQSRNLRCEIIRQCDATQSVYSRDRRTVADIQRRVDEKNSRNVLSRAFLAQSDKDTIAAWKGDLNRLLHIFNVRTVGLALPLLMTSFQTELAIDTNVTVTDSHLKVADIHNEVTNIRQDVSVIKESVSNKQHSVCHTFFTYEGTLTIP